MNSINCIRPLNQRTFYVNQYSVFMSDAYWFNSLCYGYAWAYVILWWWFCDDPIIVWILHITCGKKRHSIIGHLMLLLTFYNFIVIYYGQKFHSQSFHFLKSLISLFLSLPLSVFESFKFINICNRYTKYNKSVHFS